MAKKKKTKKELLAQKEKMREYHKEYWLKYRTPEYRAEIEKRKKYSQSEECRAERERKRIEYLKEYRLKKGIKPRPKEKKPSTHISLAEKRECYATGNYEKALKELTNKKIKLLKEWQKKYG